MGTGSSLAEAPPRYRYSGWPLALAAASARAMDTPRMALAPSWDLLSVPSRLIMSSSSSACWKASIPCRASWISVLIA